VVGRAEVTNIRASLPFAELKEPRRPMIPQPNRWNVVFAHPAFPQSVEPLLTGIHCGNLCLLGRPSISSPPCARVCLHVTPGRTQGSISYLTSP
jgi:hypothetical protein